MSSLFQFYQLFVSLLAKSNQLFHIINEYRYRHMSTSERLPWRITRWTQQGSRIRPKGHPNPGLRLPLWGDGQCRHRGLKGTRQVVERTREKYLRKCYSWGYRALLICCRVVTLHSLRLCRPNCFHIHFPLQRMNFARQQGIFLSKTYQSRFRFPIFSTWTSLFLWESFFVTCRDSLYTTESISLPHNTLTLWWYPYNVKKFPAPAPVIFPHHMGSFSTFVDIMTYRGLHTEKVYVLFWNCITVAINISQL